MTACFCWNENVRIDCVPLRSGEGWPQRDRVASPPLVVHLQVPTHHLLILLHAGGHLCDSPCDGSTLVSIRQICRVVDRHGLVGIDGPCTKERLHLAGHVGVLPRCNCSRLERVEWVKRAAKRAASSRTADETNRGSSAEYGVHRSRYSQQTKLEYFDLELTASIQYIEGRLGTRQAPQLGLSPA